MAAGLFLSIFKLLSQVLKSRCSIPTRRELVKEAARNPSTTQLKETQNEQQQFHWTSCPLSNQPLTIPIVSDSSGVLYNKAAVLESLIEAGKKSEKPVEADGNEGFEFRVRSLRDIVEVKFHVEESETKNPGMLSRLKWVCPITKKALGPGVKAVYLVPCGHAFLETVIKEMPGESCLQVCILSTWLQTLTDLSQCSEPYTENNVISILPISTVETERLNNRIQSLKQKGLTHSLKKATNLNKKRKKNIMSETGISEQTLDNQRIDSTAIPVEGGIKNEETASLTAKVLAEEQDRNKRRKMVANDNLKSLFSTKNVMNEKHTDFMTRGFSIPANAKR